MEIAGERFNVIAPPYPYAVGQEVEFCIRPEEIMLLRPDQDEGEEVKENRLTGRIVGQIAHGNRYTLFFGLSDEESSRNGNAPRRHQPGSVSPPSGAHDYDLQIELPRHVYHKLELAHEKRWAISLKKSAIHVIGPTNGRGEIP